MVLATVHAKQQLLFLEWNNFLLPNLQQKTLGQVELNPVAALLRGTKQTEKYLLIYFHQVKNCNLKGSITCWAEDLWSDTVVDVCVMTQCRPPWKSEMLSAEMWEEICSAASSTANPAGTKVWSVLDSHINFDWICKALQQTTGPIEN